MTWTRLLYIKNMKKAMCRVIPGRPMEELPISKRYQGELRKQFRIAGVPWLYELKEPKPHHRDRRPKESRASKEKKERMQKIQKNLAESSQKMLEFRQSRLDNRPLGGIDQLIAKTLPSFITDHDQNHK
jgi:hypothetical protein